MRTRVEGLLIAAAVIAAYLLVGAYVNLPLRNALKHAFGGAPIWLDHMAFMLLAKLILALFIGWALLGRREASLVSATGEGATAAGVGSGLALVLAIGATLALMGRLDLTFRPNLSLIVGNIFSNFWEELIYRGVLLGVLRKYLGNTHVAVLLAAAVFVQGHLHYPVPLVMLVFAGGVVWGYLTVKYQSIMPAYVSHMVADLVADSIFAL